MYRNQEQRDFARGLRSQPTEAEKRLWHFLRAEKLGVKFRRQAAMGAYIVDFVCFSHSLIVELDGPQHVEDKGKERDARRTAWLASRGFRVIRFRNQALDEDIRLVVEEIQRALREGALGQKQPPSPALPAEGREQEKAKNEASAPTEGGRTTVKMRASGGPLELGRLPPPCGQVAELDNFSPGVPSRICPAPSPCREGWGGGKPST